MPSEQQRVFSRIKMWRSDKGFGFSEATPREPECFLHVHELARECSDWKYSQEEIVPGMHVSFVLNESTKGPRGTQIQFHAEPEELLATIENSETENN
jgi:cold shock CspA family protein